MIIRKPTEDEKAQMLAWPVWEKERSEFPWEYSEQETCLIMEGSADIITDKETFSFGPGDVVIFPKGLRCTWKITEPIKKHYKFG